MNMSCILSVLVWQIEYLAVEYTFKEHVSLSEAENIVIIFSVNEKYIRLFAA